MKGWLRCLHEPMLTLNVNMSGAKGGSPLDRFLCFSGGSGDGVRENVGILSSPPITSNFSFLLDAVVAGPGLHLQGLEAGMIPQQETVSMFLTFTSDRISKGLMQWDVPSPHLAKLG